MQKKMKVTVIVVTYNGSKWVEECFGSLVNSSINLDIISIDNNSKDNTVKLIREKYPKVKVIETGLNLGFGKANNIGFKIAMENNSDYIYLLNQDAWIEKNTIENLINIQLSNSSFGVLSPMQMNSQKIKIDKDLSILCGEKYCPGFISDLYNKNVKEVYQISSIMAAHWLISKECALTIGGFAPIFKHYGEDDNYLHRAKYHGFHIGIAPNLKVVHDREDRKITFQAKINGLIPTFIALSCDINYNLFKATMYSSAVLIFQSVILFVHTRSLSVLLKPFFALLKFRSIIMTRKISKRKGFLLI